MAVRGRYKVRCGDRVEPEVETCNDIDDDCDGEVDNGLVRVGCGLGVCAGLGHNVCRAGVWGGCELFDYPVAESCDRLDNDCDGSVDEGLGVRLLLGGRGPARRAG